MKPGENALEPYRRKTMAGTGLVSNYPDSLVETILPKLRTSTLVQVCRGPATLNRWPILSRWYRSPSRFAFSRRFFLTRSSVCSRRVPLPAWGMFDECLSVGSWFTATSMASSTSATTGFDRGQFDASERYQMKERLRLAKVAAFVLSSLNPR